MTLEDCEKALKKLSGPDEYSRTKAHEGRRIEAVEGGWLIMNGEKYRSRMNEDERRLYKREKAVEYRQRKKVIKRDGAKSGAQQAIQEGLTEQSAEANSVDLQQ